MARYLWIAVATACLLLGQLPSRADSIPEIVARAKPAVVEIVTTDATGAPKALGTGFFISPDGLAVTNQHVIEGADSITAVGDNKAIFNFERVVAQAAGVDLVVLKFHASDVPFLKLGKSTTAVEGQKVIVIGNPTGLWRTVPDAWSTYREPGGPASSGGPQSNLFAGRLRVTVCEAAGGISCKP
jgi:S1-C subfamily serine protease